MKIKESLKIESSIIKEKVFRVSEFLDFLNKILKPCWVVVQGEVGERVDDYEERGFAFFDLLDKDRSILRCFSWREKVEDLGIKLEPGMELRVVGFPEIRKNRGELKFQVQRIELVGEGVLKKQFEVLKKKLMTLGYFDKQIKKPIPRFSEKIGLITSKYGRGAKKDFETHLGKFGLEIFFYDTRMEGSFSLYAIIEAINFFNQNLPRLDVLVITRGGGDWESLQPFNSEEIVKAIRGSAIPIITGIGHEKDETLADLAADFSASTPTHAARFLNENWKLAQRNIFELEKNFTSWILKIIKNIRYQLEFIRKNLISCFEKKIILKQEQINHLIKSMNIYFQNYFKNFEFLEKEFKNNFSKIQILINNQKTEIKQFLENLNKNRNFWQKRLRNILTQKEEKLFLSNPWLKLKQGYTITRDQFGRIIKTPQNLKLNQQIKTQFLKGSIFSKVKKIEK